MPVGLQDRPDEDPAKLSICAFCVHASRTVYRIRDEDENWKGDDTFEDFDCNHPEVRKYHGYQVVECLGFDLNEKVELPPKEEKKEPTFKEKLLRQRVNELLEQVKLLKKKVKKLKKKGKKK